MSEILFFIIGGILFVIIFVLLSRGYTKFKKLQNKKWKVKRPGSFKCLDGDVVRSKGELMIDNHLHRLGIKHVYEKTISVRGNSIKYDWYLPDSDVYIEYWGWAGKQYEKRKQEKKDLYKKGKLTLISIEDIMLADLYPQLEEELNKHIKTKKKKTKGKKFCPNCGEILDERF